MSGSDYEIEYLDEDAEVVQQCVKSAENYAVDDKDDTDRLPPLLAERIPPCITVKRKKVEEDSDYDPHEDMARPRKKRPTIITQRPNTTIKVKPQKSNIDLLQVHIKKAPYTQSNTLYRTPHKLETFKNTVKDHILNKCDVTKRRKLNIRIPDYEDPLCLPVKAVVKDDSEKKRLDDWNRLCLDHFKESDVTLKAVSGVAVASKRTVVLRNVKNSLTGKTEMSVWSKTSVQDDREEMQSEVLQCILPKFREKKLLNYILNDKITKYKPFNHTNEVILSKEEYKDDKVLVVYKPREALASVFKAENEIKSEKPEDDKSNDIDRLCMVEKTCCRVCAPCFHKSWRGVKKADKDKICCPICMRTYINVYNLIAHIKMHSSQAVHKHKRTINKILANVIEYHYRCRVCLDKIPSIKALRKHLATHKCNESFICEVGNHVVS